MPLDVDHYISQIRVNPEWRWIYLALKKITTHVNQLATNSGSDTQTLPAPPQIASLTVKSSGTGLVHLSISDPANISRNLRYFAEYWPATTASSPPVNPHVIDLGASREHIFRLPGLDDSSNPQSFNFHAYSQYPGSDSPSPPVRYPNLVSPGGTDTLSLLPSTGSGTAPNSGALGASGLGKVLHRSL